MPSRAHAMGTNRLTASQQIPVTRANAMQDWVQANRRRQSQEHLKKLQMRKSRTTGVLPHLAMRRIGDACAERSCLGASNESALCEGERADSGFALGQAER